MKRPLGIAFVLLLVLPCAQPVSAQDNALAWLDAMRVSAGAPPVRTDALLSRTALDWATVLAAAGVISHRGADGSDALDRYRTLGGTEVRVGEIIGAGPQLSAIEKGWAASASHRALAVKDSWTHAGFGQRSTGRGSEVCVVMFCIKGVDGLRITQDESRLLVSGSFTSKAAAGALLLAGVDARKPGSWDPLSRAFTFQLSSAGLPSYIRLGFVTSDGGFTLTNAFTLPRGTVSPAAKGRFSAPAEQP